MVANALSVFDNSEIIAGMLVRHKPTRQKVDTAEHAYSLFREGKAREAHRLGEK